MKYKTKVEPREGQTFEAVDGERRTVHAVELVDRHYVVRYHTSRRPDEESREVPLTRWMR